MLQNYESQTGSVSQQQEFLPKQKSRRKGLSVITMFLASMLVEWPLAWQPTNFSYIYAGQTRESSKNRAPVEIVFSTVWHGRHLLEHNLQALRVLRERFPTISFLHFVSPAYFTKPGVKPKLIVKKIKKLIKPEDGVGLFLSSWRSLVESAAVTFKVAPTFWGNRLSQEDCVIDCGEEIPLTTYSENDLIKMVRKSVVLFDELALPRPKDFLANGWMTNAPLLNALSSNGFKADYSRVPLKLLEAKIKYYPIFNWLNTLPGVSSFSPSTTAPTVYGDVKQCVQSAGNTEFWSVEGLKAHFDSFIMAQNVQPEQPLTFHLSISQESALFEVEKLSEVLQYIFAKSHELNLNIKFPPLGNRSGEFASRGLDPRVHDLSRLRVRDAL